VLDFLQRHPHVRLHFTPTYSSWPNEVELCFARIEREVIARGIFTSLKDLARKLMRYIHAYSAAAKPFSWRYSDVNRRIHTKELNTTSH
jgi:transposase